MCNVYQFQLQFFSTGVVKIENERKSEVSTNEWQIQVLDYFLWDQTLKISLPQDAVMTPIEQIVFKNSYCDSLSKTKTMPFGDSKFH